MGLVRETERRERLSLEKEDETQEINWMETNFVNVRDSFEAV